MFRNGVWFYRDKNSGVFYVKYIRIEFDYLRIGIKYNSCLVVIIINFFLYNKCICDWCM